MCVVSMIYDYYNRQPWTWPKPYKYPWDNPQIDPPWVTQPESPGQKQEAIDALRELIKKAEEMDKAVGEPDCQDPEKAKLLERIAVLEQQVQQLLKKKKAKKVKKKVVDKKKKII